MRKKPHNQLRGKKKLHMSSYSSKKRVERSDSRYVLGFHVDLEWAKKAKFTELTNILEEQGMEHLFEIV